MAHDTEYSDGDSDRIEAKVQQALDARDSRDIAERPVPLPLGKIIAVGAVIVSLVWWLAGEHAEIVALKSNYEAGERRDQQNETALAELAKSLQAAEKIQAASLATLEAVRVEVQRNSALLEDLRRRP